MNHAFQHVANREYNFWIGVRDASGSLVGTGDTGRVISQSIVLAAAEIAKDFKIDEGVVVLSSDDFSENLTASLSEISTW